MADVWHTVGMTIKWLMLALAAAALLAAGFWYVRTYTTLMTMTRNAQPESASSKQAAKQMETALLAGGCFWCVEADLEKIPGVVEAISGYSGGTTTEPTYENYAEGGHREVVQVHYDPRAVSYRGLIEYFLKHIDPTDPNGSFHDRGVEYSPAIYYYSDEQKNVAATVIAEIEGRDVFDQPLAVPVLPAQEFYPAEDYHQNYYQTHSIRYNLYRKASGRDAFIKRHWGEEAKQLPAMPATYTASTSPWRDFEKPSEQELRERLTDEQYAVTQNDETERAFENDLWDEKRDGIYVDVVSGEPLFSSLDKFESGTGWPSFTKPLEPAHIIERDDFSFLGRRTEIRSRFADSHLGHVFYDGPPPTHLRYCMNSAALRFIPKDKLREEGYERYADLFD